MAVQSCEEFPLLLTVPQAAEALAISQRTLWSLTTSGDIPHVRIGRSVRYLKSDLEAWVAGCRKGGDV